MKRVLLGALFCAAFVALAYRPAMAVVEFCPASLHDALVNPTGGEASGGASFAGFVLAAQGPRTVGATLAFETSGGWFTAVVPAVPLTEKTRRYTSVSAKFVRHDFVSPVMYVRFPSSVSVKHSWVYEALATGDGPFGWEKRGPVTCSPPADDPRPAQTPPYAPAMDPADKDVLDAPPQSRSIVLAASPSGPLENASCAEPFEPATTVHVEAPRYPADLRGVAANSTIQVAIAADGSLTDAWIWGPSGYPEMDEISLEAAKRSTYKGGHAYCNGVPGMYFFRVTFLPH